MDSVLPSVLVAVIGLIGPLLVYLNGRFDGPASRAARLESLTKTLDSLRPTSLDHIVLSLVRRQLILDEHYKTLGPKLHKYVVILAFIMSGLGTIAALNIWLNFADQYMTQIAISQIGLVVLQSGLTVAQNMKHNRYEELLIEDVKKSADALSPPPLTGPAAN